MQFTNRVRVVIFSGVVLLLVAFGLIGVNMLQAPKSDLSLPTGTAKSIKGDPSQEMRGSSIKSHAGLSSGHFVFKNKKALAVAASVVTLLVVSALILSMYFYFGPTQNADAGVLPVLDVEASYPPTFYLIAAGAGLALVVGLGVTLYCCANRGKGVLSKIPFLNSNSDVFLVSPEVALSGNTDYASLSQNRDLIQKAIIFNSATVPGYPLLRNFQTASKLIAQKNYQYGKAESYSGFFVPQRNKGESALYLLKLLQEKDEGVSIDELQLVHVSVPAPQDLDYFQKMACLNTAIDIIKSEMIGFILSLLEQTAALKAAEVLLGVEKIKVNGTYSNANGKMPLLLDKKFFLHSLYGLYKDSNFIPLLPTYVGSLPISGIWESVGSELVLYYVQVSELENLATSELVELFKNANTFYFWLRDYLVSVNLPVV